MQSHLMWINPQLKIVPSRRSTSSRDQLFEGMTQSFYDVKLNTVFKSLVSHRWCRVSDVFHRSTEDARLQTNMALFFSGAVTSTSSSKGLRLTPGFIHRILSEPVFGTFYRLND